MVQDLGGARYPIEVVDQFTGPLEALKTSLAEVRAQFEELRTIGAPFQQIRKQAAEAKEALDTQAEGFAKNAKAARNLEVALHQQTAALETGVDAIKKQVKELSAYEEGLAAAGKAIRKQQIEEAKLQALQEAGVQTQQEITAAMRESTRARADQAAESRNLAAQEAQFRAAELAALQKNIKLRNESRLDSPENRSGLSQERLRIEAEESRRLAALQQEQNEQRQRALREDILARNEATRERVRQSAQEGLRLAAQDEKNHKKDLVQLQEHIKAKSEAETKAQQERAAALAKSPEGRSQAAVAQDIARLQKAQATIAAFERGQQVLPATLRRARAEVKALTGDLDASGRSANRISFTFRRLFGILAAFTIAREALSLFRQLIFDGIKFNAELEQAETSLAAILASTGQVRDVTGQAVEGAQAFAIAQGEARKQVALLRADSLRTTATLKDLVFAFQTAIGPGLQAGFNIDEIREFSVQISQAATAIGLEQTQLAEEVRSILQGTIQARTTRIATVLGVSNEDIRRAREAGRLFEFLNKRFQQFSIATEESSQNFTVIVTRLRNAIQLVLGAGSTSFFNTLKTDLKEILGTLVQIESGRVLINPRAVAIVQSVLDGIGDAARILFNLADEITFEDALSAAKGIGDAFRAAATVGRAFIAGVSQALGDLSTIFRPFTELFSGKLGGLVGTVLGQLVRVLTIVSAIGLAFKGLFFPISAALTIFRSINREVRLFDTLLKGSIRTAGKLRATMSSLAKTATIVGGLFAFEKNLEEARKLLDFRSGRGGPVFDPLPEDIDLEVRDAFALTTASARNIIGILSDEEFDRIRDGIRNKVLREWEKVANLTIKPGSMLDIVDGVSGSIASARRETKQFEDALRDVREEAELTGEQFEDFIRFRGADGGAALQISQEIVKSRIDLERETLTLKREEEEIEARIAEAAAQRIALEEKVVALNREQTDTLELFLASSRNLAALQRQQASAQAEGLDTTEIDEEIAQLRANLDSIAAPTLVKGGLFDAVREAAEETLRLNVADTANAEQLRAIQASRVDLERELNDIMRTRVERFAAEELRSAIEQRQQIELRARAEERLNQARRSPLAITEDPVRFQLAEARNVLEARELENQTSLLRVKAEIARLEQSRTDAFQRAGPNATGEILEIERLIAERKREQVALTKDQTSNILVLKLRLQELEQAAASFGGEFRLGIEAAFAQFQEQAPDTFQATFRAVQTGLDGLVQVGKQAFASIFDPNSNFSIREALGRLALDIASQLFADALQGLIAGLFQTQATTVTAATTAAGILVTAGEAVAASIVAGATTAAGILAGGSAVSSAAPVTTSFLNETLFPSRGGQVPEPQYRARGGYGWHPGAPRGTDTVPAWLTPKEYVVRAREAARPEVLRVLQAINEGRVPEGVLRVVADSTRAMRSVPSVATKTPQHFAGGGSVGAGGARAPQVLPVAVMDPKTVDLLLTQGEGQLMRFLAEKGVPMGVR